MPRRSRKAREPLEIIPISPTASLDGSKRLPSLLPMLTPVHPNFRKHVPRQECILTPPVTIKNCKYLRDPEFLPAQVIRLEKHSAVPVLEIPIQLSSDEMPSDDIHPCLYYVSCDVFIKHSNFAQYFSSYSPGQGEFDSTKAVGSELLESYLETKPHDDSQLTVAIVKPKPHIFSFSSVPTLPDDFEFFDTQLTLTGINVPLSISLLVAQGILSLHYVPERSALQFIVHNLPTLFSNRLSKHMSNFLSWLRNFRGENVVTPNPDYERDWVFDAVRRTSADTDTAPWTKYLDQVRSIDSLHVKLRKYQENAVAWMLSRELNPPIPIFADEGTVWSQTSDLAEQCVLNRKNVKILNKFAFCSSTSDTWFGSHDQKRLSAIQIGPGGLLCDEMGLGKTVELMQLVLCNQRPLTENVPMCASPSRQCGECGGKQGLFYRQSCVECKSFYHKTCMPAPSNSQNCFLCCKCMQLMSEFCHESTSASALPESRATLVIVPPALLLQWQAELAKHVKKALNVVTFLGLKRSGYIPQSVLLEADVVLSTYDALKSDVATVQALRNPRTDLRGKKQYYPTPVPLLLIRWHRLALDESQMLGTSMNTNCLRMTRFLHAKYRWCVTGTPIADILAGSLAMLSVLCSPDGTEIPWQKLCVPSVYIDDRKWVSSLLRSTIWRTMKVDVEDDQLNLPPQIVEVARTKFGPIEKYHYQSLQREVMNFRASQQNRSTSSSKFSREILTTLRQACCHPNVGSSGRRLFLIRSRREIQKRQENCGQGGDRIERPMEMSEVLASMISKSRVECQDALRNCVAVLNGVAGIALVKCALAPHMTTRVHPIASAITTYREGLSLAAGMEHLFKMDVIQRMHILFNLSEALDLADDTSKSLSSLSDQTDHVRERIERLEGLGRLQGEHSLKEDFLNLRSSYLCNAEIHLKSVTADLESKNAKLGIAPLIYSCTEQSDSSLCSSNRTSETDQGFSIQGIPAKGTRWWERALAIILEGSDQKLAQQMHETDENGSGIEALNWRQPSDVGTFVHDVLDALEANRKNVNRSSSPLFNRLGNIMNFANVIETEINALLDARKILIETLKALPGGKPPTEIEVEISGHCKECRESMEGDPCAHCLAEELVQNVEERLYSVSDSFMNVENLSSIEDPFYRPERVTRAASVRSSMVGSLRPSSRIRHRSGSRMPGELEIVLKKVASAAFKIVRCPIFKRNMSIWMDQMQKMKDEFATAKSVLEAQRSLLASMDEVKMAQTRLKLYDGPSSSLTYLEKRYHVAKNEVNVMSKEFKTDRSIALKDLEGKRRRLSYLLTLKKDMESPVTGKHGRDDFEETCVICYAKFQDVGKLGVLKCGHLYCGDCTVNLIKRQGSARNDPSLEIPCPTCRSASPVAEISITNIVSSRCPKKRRFNMENEKNACSPNIAVGGCETSESKQIDDTKGKAENIPQSEDGSSSDHNRELSAQNQRLFRDFSRKELTSTFIDWSRHVIGSNGSKTALLIKLLSGIWRKERTAKVVVFSEWEEALDLIRNALNANHMQCYDGGSSARSSDTFSQVIHKFKCDTLGVCLLLPLKKAAAGLNLIEATHVVLVEPSMDIRLEKQAIGRVHRIGQTHVTYVHHLITDDTIEELIFKRGDRWRQIGSSSISDTTGLIDEGVLGRPEQLVNEAISGGLIGSCFDLEIGSNAPIVNLTSEIEVINDDEPSASEGGNIPVMT